MISIAIKIMTIVFIFVSVFTIEKKNIIVVKIIKSVNKSYRNLLNRQGPILKLLLLVSGIIVLMSVYLISFEKICLVDGKSIIYNKIPISILVWIGIVFLIYFGFGCILAVFYMNLEIIGNVKDSKMEVKMMCSFLLLSSFLFVSIIAEDKMRDNLFFLLAGLILCYILNMQILFKIVKNPFCIIEENNKQESKNRMLILFTSVLVIFMIIINMYLMVLWTDFSISKAYMYNGQYTLSKWQLFYYTMISFTTIGYGDICPAAFESQVVSVLISITSVICLVIFISSLLSVKDDIFESKE